MCNNASVREERNFITSMLDKKKTGQEITRDVPPTFLIRKPRRESKSNSGLEFWCENFFYAVEEKEQQDTHGELLTQMMKKNTSSKFLLESSLGC
jgi:hypothetical protein